MRGWPGGRCERGRPTFSCRRGDLQVSTPFVGRLVPDLPSERREAYDRIGNVGVVCVVFRLLREVTPHFWVNISDPRFEIPGIIDFRVCAPPATRLSFFPITCRQSTRNSRGATRICGGSPGFSETSQSRDIGPRRCRDACRASAPRATGLPPGFAAMLPPDRDQYSRAANRRHLLLLSGGSGNFRERAFGQADRASVFLTAVHALLRFALYASSTREVRLAPSSGCARSGRLPPENRVRYTLRSMKIARNGNAQL